jgi:hypothetical protein
MELFGHLFIFMLDGMNSLDRAARPHIQKMIRDYDRLIENPKQYFEQFETVVIPPFRPRFLPGCLGLVACFFIGAILISTVYSLKQPLRGIVVGSSLLLSILVTFLIVRRSLSGSRIELTADGVWFFLRARRVYCPWKFFDAKQLWFERDDRRIDFSIHADALQDCELWISHQQLSWTKLTTKPLKIRDIPKNAEDADFPHNITTASLYDIHGCRSTEVIDTICTLAWKLSER